ncbi:MAG: hypothetical protein ACLQIB_43425 [Isosphaeraceae bacterium]
MQCNDVIRELAAPSDDRNFTALAEHLAECAACSEWAKRASQLDRLWEFTRPSDPSPQAWEAVWTRIVETVDSSTLAPVEHPGAAAAIRNGSTPKVEPALGHPSRSFRRRPWSFAAVASFGLAQAAAVLLVVGVAWHSFPLSQNTQIAKNPVPSLALPNSSAADSASLSIDIEEGSLVIIRSEGKKLEASVLTSENSPFGIGRPVDGNVAKAGQVRRSGNPPYGEFGSARRLDGWLLMFNYAESMASSPVVAMKE